MRRWLLPTIMLLLVGASCFGFRAWGDSQQRDFMRSRGEISAVAESGAAGLVIVTSATGYRRGRWLVDDAGKAVGAPGGFVGEDLPAGAVPGDPQSISCVGQLCYQVAGDTLRVDRSDDGGLTWGVAWQVSATDYQVLLRDYAEPDPAAHLASRSVVVHATAGGHVVFVANGRRSPGARSSSLGWSWWLPGARAVSCVSSRSAGSRPWPPMAPIYRPICHRWGCFRAGSPAAT